MIMMIIIAIIIIIIIIIIITKMSRLRRNLLNLRLTETDLCQAKKLFCFIIKKNYEVRLSKFN